MARVVKPGGRLLLLEHGRGTWDWVNGILNAGEEKHCKARCVQATLLLLPPSPGSAPHASLPAAAGYSGARRLNGTGPSARAQQARCGRMFAPPAACRLSQKWGCQWNRPIDELVAKAGLEVRPEVESIREDIAVAVMWVQSELWAKQK